MKLDKTRNSDAAAARPWEDRNEVPFREESKRDRRQAEDLKDLNQTLEDLNTPTH